MSEVDSTDIGREPTPWVRAISLPSALLGIVAFSLPWLQVSCGPVKVQLSGYELASGNWVQKVDLAELTPALSQSQEKTNPQRSPQNRDDSFRKPAPSGDPLLWIVPLACLVLLILGVFNVPRVPTLLVSVLASVYLAFFGIINEQQLNDPRYTKGVLDHSWLIGYWLSWIGLLAPAVVSVLKPRKT